MWSPSHIHPGPRQGLECKKNRLWHNDPCARYSTGAFPQPGCVGGLLYKIHDIYPGTNPVTSNRCMSVDVPGLLGRRHRAELQREAFPTHYVNVRRGSGKSKRVYQNCTSHEEYSCCIIAQKQRKRCCAFHRYINPPRALSLPPLAGSAQERPRRKTCRTFAQFAKTGGRKQAQPRTNATKKTMALSSMATLLPFSLSLPAIGLGLLVAWFVGSTLYQWQRLRHVPGPWLASFSYL